VQRRRDRAICCADDRVIVSCLVHHISVSAISLTRALSVRARQNTTEVEMLHYKLITYKDILSCCTQNGRINCAVRITGNLH